MSRGVARRCCSGSRSCSVGSPPPTSRAASPPYGRSSGRPWRSSSRARTWPPDAGSARATSPCDGCPQRYAPVGAATVPETLIGQRLAAPVVRGGYVGAALIAIDPALAGPPVRAGERAAEVIALGARALVVPGARVDVLVTRDGEGGAMAGTELALEDVEVLAARGAPPAARAETGERVAATLRVSRARRGLPHRGAVVRARAAPAPARDRRRPAQRPDRRRPGAALSAPGGDQAVPRARAAQATSADLPTLALIPDPPTSRRERAARCTAVLGYAYSPQTLAHDPPASSLQITGRAFPLGSANVAQAVLTAQAHELVERSALNRSLARIALAPAPLEALLAVHTESYLNRFRDACAGGPWDGEHAPVTPGTWEAARLTVGGVLAAVDAVVDGRLRSALVHARPAGHHAEPDRAIASTYLNNVACGVEHARARGVERVAIVDWDVHVGNGAERIFWDRDDVLAISLHQQDWYPAHAGALRATGGPGAEGCTVNVPLPPASTDAGYLLAFDEIVVPIVRGFRPELILVAAGQDASVFDPTGRMLVSAAGFRGLAERVAALADELTDGRLVVSTEGGYSPIYNPFCLLGVLEGLAGESGGIVDPWHDDATVLATRAPADDRVRAAIAAVRSAQPRWFSVLERASKPGAVQAHAAPMPVSART